MSEITENKTLEITLDQEASQLFDAYQRYTGISSDAYVLELIRKTLPTLRAIVESFDEAEGDGDKVMELFGRKMGEVMLAQKAASEPQKDAQLAANG